MSRFPWKLSWKGWMVPVLLLGTMAYAIAEEITLTTFYPSPRGVYKELRVGSGSVPTPTAKLQVSLPTAENGLAVRVDGNTTASPFVIDKNGNVGVGTPSPGDKLTVAGGHVTLDAGNALKWGSAGNERIQATSGVLSFFNNNTEKMTIRGDRVGLGTTSPAEQLETTARVRIGAGGTNAACALQLGGTANLGLTNPVSNQLGIVTNGSERIRVDDNGNVGIGTAAQIARLHVKGAGTTNATFAFGVSNAVDTPLLGVRDDGVLFGFRDAVFSGKVTATSDVRLKQHIQPLTQPLEQIDRLRGVRFEWNEAAKALGHRPGEPDIGVIAQEVGAVFPELVSGASEGRYQAVDYSRLTAVLIEAIKALQAQQEILTKRLKALEAAPCATGNTTPTHSIQGTE